MRKAEEFETRVAESLAEAAEQIHASDLLRFRIQSQLFQLKKEQKMKKTISFKRIVIVAIAICLLGTATAFAAGKITSFVTLAGNGKTYTQIPAASELQRTVGFAPKIVERFSNGFSFDKTDTSETAGRDESDMQVCKFSQLDTEYRFNEREVTLVTKLHSDKRSDTDPGELSSHGAIDLKYASQVYKSVPVGYEMTQEDKQAQQSGAIEFSEGSDSVEMSTLQFVNWTDAGIDYLLMTDDTALQKADLLQMAGEVIDCP